MVATVGTLVTDGALLVTGLLVLSWLLVISRVVGVGSARCLADSSDLVLCSRVIVYWCVAELASKLRERSWGSALDKAPGKLLGLYSGKLLGKCSWEASGGSTPGKLWVPISYWGGCSTPYIIVNF